MIALFESYNLGKRKEVATCNKYSFLGSINFRPFFPPLISLGHNFHEKKLKYFVFESETLPVHSLIPPSHSNFLVCSDSYLRDPCCSKMMRCKSSIGPLAVPWAGTTLLLCDSDPMFLQQPQHLYYENFLPDV